MSIPISILVCLVLTGLTGTIAYLAFWIIRKIVSKTRIIMAQYILLKVVILAFVLPVCHLAEVVISYEAGTWSGSLFAVTVTTYQVTCILLGIWIVGMTVSALLLARRVRMLRLQLSTYEQTDIYHEILKAEAEKLGIKRAVSVRVGDYYTSPNTAGVFSPSIYLNVNTCTEADLPYVFRHELIHHKHGDVLMLYAVEILRVVYWFHPLFIARKILRQYQELMEDACDIEVCKGISDDRFYIGVLLKMVMKDQEIHQTVPAFLSETMKDVMRRIENMKEYKKQKPMKRMLVSALAIVVFCGSSIAVYAAERGVVEGYDKLYYATWEGVEEELQEPVNTLEEYIERSLFDEGITVEYTDSEIMTLSGAYHVDYNLGAYTERRGTSHVLEAGDRVTLVLAVNPDDKNVKVGFRMSTGETRYIVGSGVIDHTFTIYDDATYTFFVQNNNASQVSVSGSYVIP